MGDDSYFSKSNKAREVRLALLRDGAARPLEPLADDECLFRAVTPTMGVRGKHIPIRRWNPYVNGGVSVNRSGHSIPLDLRYTMADPNVGWAVAEVRQVRKEREIHVPTMTRVGAGDKVFTHFGTGGAQRIGLDVYHSPSAAHVRNERNFPDNFAHSSIQISFGGGGIEDVPEHVVQAIERQGDEFRQLLHVAFVVQELPS